MWAEPLTVTATQTRDAEYVVGVHAGDGTLVAMVAVATGARNRCGYFGEMNVLDDNGGTRQRLRALALLVREAIRYAAQLGITHGETDVALDRPVLRAFAEKMSGVALDERGHLTGPLERMHTNVLNVTDDDGNDRGAPLP
jgi:hypothetical protein